MFASTCHLLAGPSMVGALFAVVVQIIPLRWKHERFRRRRILLLAATAMMPCGMALAGAPAPDARPTAGVVANGAATITTQASTVTVNQASNAAVINWGSFNIGSQVTVKIVMPSANSVELDRVIGAPAPSQIFGKLDSNGIIFLVNPNGILFGQGALVNVGGLLATTSSITDRNFMAGQYVFTKGSNRAASVVNLGNITAASGGFAALVAPGVRNAGTITAKIGNVGLSAGNDFTLDMFGDKLITLAVNDKIAKQVIDVATGKPLASLVTNTGTLSADGGTVQITAAAARVVVNSVINTSGTIEANTVSGHGGMIVLSAATSMTKGTGAPAQNVKVAGTLSTKGVSTGSTGGSVKITGENITLAGAKIKASGKAGGGTVLIGGDVGGGKPNDATTVTANAASTINASAAVNGNGGKVVIWSDQLTTFTGLIKATGGASGGNGGFVETSGGSVNLTGIHVDVTAPAGTPGTWLQ